MAHHITQIFEMLNLQPDEEFQLANDYTHRTFRLTNKLHVQSKTTIDTTWTEHPEMLARLLSGQALILKIPVKSRLQLLHEDMIDRQYDYRLSTDGNIYLVTDMDYSETEILQGNTGTYEEMLFLKEKRQVESEIRFLQKQSLNNKDFNKSPYIFYYCYWDNDDAQFEIGIASDIKPNNLCFPQKDDVLNMLRIIGEDRYKKYILEL